MATRLGIYNSALTKHLGQTEIASLSEEVESRRVLDRVWNDNFVKSVLEMGYWKFACRTVKLEPDPSVTPSFGYRNAFSHPDDYVHPAAICSDEHLKTPVLHYQDEGTYWFADLGELYVQYVSIGDSYGNDLSLWPESFTKFAEVYLAMECAIRLNQSESKWEKLFKLQRKLLSEAKSKDAIKGPTRFLPPGGWTSARTNGHSNVGDRAARSQLLG